MLDVSGLASLHYLIGQSYTLTCDCSGLVDASGATYQWYKNGNTLSSEEGPNVTFSNLQLSDAANYTCSATIHGMVQHLRGDPLIITVQSKSESGYLKSSYSDDHECAMSPAVPAPSHVILRQNKPNPIRPIGSNVTLTCIVELPRAVVAARGQLMVNIELEDPAGNTLTGASLVQQSPSTHVSRAEIRSFERRHSGVYTCAATLTSRSPYLTESSTLTDDITLSSGKITL